MDIKVDLELEKLISNGASIREDSNQINAKDGMQLIINYIKK